MHREKHIAATPASPPKSPLDLWKLMGTGGRAQRVQQQKGLPPSDSLLAVFKNQVTYTFILGREVASIHFDRGRGEIFFKGHNIHNLSLDEAQKGALKGLKRVLEGDERGADFLSDYDATLARVTAENK